MLLMRAVVATLAMFAAACTTPRPDTGEEATEADTCGMARFAHLVGQPADNIDRSSLPERARVITPDMMVTQDFSAERLNIFVGTDGRVGSLRCF